MRVRDFCRWKLENKGLYYRDFRGALIRYDIRWVKFYILDTIFEELFNKYKHIYLEIQKYTRKVLMATYNITVYVKITFSMFYTR